MKEDFLHFLWRTKRFEPSHLQTTQGETLQIIDFGTYNTNAGPDFLNAKIRIGNTLWAGNVEMHLRTSEWQNHGHSQDKHYDRAVILHVVWEENTQIERTNGALIPCLTLKNIISSKLVTAYLALQAKENWIPCEKLFPTVSELTKEMWLERLTIERLERKSEEIEQLLVATKNHWEETFYHFLARSFGSKVNAVAFDALASAVPMSILGKHKNSLSQIESLVFGQAGFLADEWKESYPAMLKKEYQFLQKKYTLQPIEKEMWKFLRLRPANFPTIRLAQFASLIHQSSHLFSKILVAQTVKEVEKLFQTEVSDYWQTHYIFEKASPPRSKKFGKEAIKVLIINVIIPFVFLYGKMRKEEDLQNRALVWLEMLEPESNTIIAEWKKLGLEATHAGRTQALLQLKNEYCTPHRCLHCAIGNAILQK